MTLATDHLRDALGHGASDKRLDILSRIGQVGSISKAARAAGVSYKAAWQAVETLSNLAGQPLLEKAVGGRGGGGAKLTPAGMQLLAAAQQLQNARSQAVAQAVAVMQQQTGPALDARGVSALGLRTSMRNTLPGSVTHLKTVDGAMHVSLRLDDGQTLTARITRESAQLLGLAKGLPVLALCKATAVRVAALPESRDTAHNTVAPDQALHGNVLHGNVLRGTVARLPAKGRAGEVSLQLREDLHLIGFAAADHGLRKGAAACALLDASTVVIALGH